MKQSVSANSIIEGLDVLNYNISKFGSQNLSHLTRTNICSYVDLAVNFVYKYVRQVT